ncbi:alpha/beta fold hydrolase [Terricaulis sp.]|uniref:alpha/beta fold hydrolase n=1 Tax=Terricaulis sp. TaxID=2768686 RepID=UPI003784FBD5
MPNDLGGIPFQWIEFDKNGALKDGRPMVAPEITDAIIMAHGWKTDRPAAIGQYEPLFENIAATWEAGAPAKPAGRTYAILGVLWPSRAFDAHYEDPKSLEGAALSTGQGHAAQDIPTARLDDEINAFAEFTDTDPDVITQLAEDIIANGMRRENCADMMETAVAAVGLNRNDAELKADARHFTREDAQMALQSLSAPDTLRLSGPVGAAQGLGETVTSAFAGAKTAIARLLNQLTFYEMKKRAGAVGKGLASEIIDKLQGQNLKRVHLIGHSFGARVVTSAAFSANKPSKLTSMTMLQGAFSHNALSKSHHGAFQDAYANVAGPTLITHTHNDKAVTLAYALASRLARDNSRDIGDASDEFGAIGANGALFLPNGVATAVTSAANPLELSAGKVHNIQCDAVIKDHMDVGNPKVAALVAHALGA